MDARFTGQNPIVAAATRLRECRRLEEAAAGTGAGALAHPEDAEASLRRFAKLLSDGCTRVNAVFGARAGIKVVSLERPLRLRVRRGESRVALDLDEVHQLVRVTGLDLDGEYQFDPSAPVPALINLSKISTEPDYGVRLTPSLLLEQVSK